MKDETQQKTSTASPTDLNALRIKIAELMGYERWETANKARVWLCKPRDEAQRQYWLSCGDAVTDKPITFDCTNIPNYPSDLNAALTLIDFLADRGWHCRLGNGLDKTWECEFYRDATGDTRAEDIGTICGVQGDQEIHYESADILAEAISKGFVLVMEGKSNQEGTQL